MRKLLGWVLVGLLLAPLGADAVAAKKKKKNKGSRDSVVNQSFADVERWVERFEDPERVEWQRPSLVLRVLGLDLGSTVADLGTGTGYFLPWLSTMVADKGKVYAVDVEQTMLDYIETRPGITHDNIVPVLADKDDPNLPDNELDVILIVNTWHHIGDRVDYLTHLESSLRPAGRVAVIDYHAGDLPVGPDDDHKLPREAVIEEFEEAGWTLAGESVALPYQYFLIFTPSKSEWREWGETVVIETEDTRR